VPETEPLPSSPRGPVKIEVLGDAAASDMAEIAARTGANVRDG
jgi:hypothetical protein